MTFLLLGLRMFQMCCEDILFARKTSFCLKRFQLSESLFVRKMFDWFQLISIPGLLITLHNFQQIVNCQLNCVKSLQSQLLSTSV